MQAAFFFFNTTDTRKETSQISFLLRIRCFWYVEDVTRPTRTAQNMTKKSRTMWFDNGVCWSCRNAVWSRDNHPYVRYKKKTTSFPSSSLRAERAPCTLRSSLLSWFILDSKLKKHVHTLTVEGAQRTTLCTLCIRLACLVERLHVWEGILIQVNQSGSTQFLSSVLHFVGGRCLDLEQESHDRG